MGRRGILHGGRVRALAAVAALVACILAWPADGQVVCTGGGCGGGGAVTSPVTTDPVSATGVWTFDNAANTPLVCSDGITAPTLASAAGANLALSATAPAATTGASQVGKAVTVTASAAVASTDTAGAAAGGSVTITAGNAARLTSGNANGGDITLQAGAGIGTGTTGLVIIPNTYGLRMGENLVFVGTGTGLWQGVMNNVDRFGWYSDRFYLANGAQLGFGSGSVSTEDVGLVRVAAGELRVSNASTGVGTLHYTVNTETVAATKTPAITEAAELYTNGADVDGQAITLTNDPTVGTCFEFALTSTDSSGSFAIAPSAGETLMDAATTCSTSFSATAKGATARICAVSGGSGGLWLVMSKNGTWTCS